VIPLNEGLELKRPAAQESPAGGARAGFGKILLSGTPEVFVLVLGVEPKYRPARPIKAVAQQ
jgi:hypothetical protein